MFDFLKKKQDRTLPEPYVKTIDTQGRMLWRWKPLEIIFKAYLEEMDGEQRLVLGLLSDALLRDRYTVDRPRTIEEEIEIALLEYWRYSKASDRYVHIDLTVYGEDGTSLGVFCHALDANVMKLDLNSIDIEMAKPTARRLVCAMSQYKCTDVHKVVIEIRQQGNP